MQIGIDSFVAAVPDTLTGENLGPADRLADLIAEIECADRAGLNVFGIGEHHRAEFLDSAPDILNLTRKTRLQSSAWYNRIVESSGLMASPRNGIEIATRRRLYASL